MIVVNSDKWVKDLNSRWKLYGFIGGSSKKMLVSFLSWRILVLGKWTEIPQHIRIWLLVYGPILE
jgi:hypothetical protein